MKNINISEDLQQKIPHLQLHPIHLAVNLKTEIPILKGKIDTKITALSSTLKMEDIAQQANIAAARNAYKACGKKPSRYRLSAEALLRRVVNGKGLYHINNVVDAINYTSISTGLSIGGYDADLIQGAIQMGIGRKDEPYDAIGRGALNIENMPLFRDDIGAFGSMTSDSSRTAINENTKNILLIIVDFGGLGTDEAARLLQEAIHYDL